mmetsp:Transcript_24948/g.37902  ORF Transcript_24948/g.37902 Transcript_24948/m.37902 type:complete len:355 (+) Transcript_24948:60-1124(+)
MLMVYALKKLVQQQIMIFIILFASFLLIFILSSYVVGRKWESDWSSSSSTPVSLRRCPNPNCIRCQRYQIVQQSARRRLPYLIREWEKKNNDKNAETVLHKVIEGVRIGPPPLPDSSKWKKMLVRQRQMKNASGQYPTVLFLPGLTVSPIVTQYHEEACRLLSPKATIKSVKESLMEEYLASQFNGGVWQMNDAGALEKGRNENQLWEVLYLLNQGKWIKENTRSCCKTFSLVKKLSGLMDGCMFGNIFFSVLYPGTKIEEHCGPTNVRHRLHFPLLLPSKDNTHQRPMLRVMSEKIQWVDNNTFVFDDSLIHAAEYPDNDASEVRVVLIIDLWHPDLSLDERQMISELYPSAT